MIWGKEVIIDLSCKSKGWNKIEPMAIMRTFLQLAPADGHPVMGGGGKKNLKIQTAYQISCLGGCDVGALLIVGPTHCSKNIKKILLFGLLFLRCA
jgi:hypothetical protein